MCSIPTTMRSKPILQLLYLLKKFIGNVLSFALNTRNFVKSREQCSDVWQESLVGKDEFLYKFLSRYINVEHNFTNTRNVRKP